MVKFKLCDKCKGKYKLYKRAWRVRAKKINSVSKQKLSIKKVK